MSQKAGISESSHRKRWLVCIGVAILVLLSITVAGCLAPPLPPGVEVAQEAPPSATPTATNTPVPEWPPTWTPTPTYTPWPTMTPTATPTFTPLPSRLLSPAGSVTGSGCRPGQSKGPLKIDYEFKGAWCPGNGQNYVANFIISATGGDGCYTYYRDIDLIGGPVRGTAEYQVQWAKCGGAPGTFFVESGDGQRAAIKFWVRPPSCCK
jgi:hypothetical protein